MMNAPIIVLLSIAIPTVTYAAESTASAIDIAQAAQYFREAQDLWKADAGKLWGISLESPLLFADPMTRRVVASQADAEGNLRLDNGVFVGELPESVGIANYAITWAGVKWTMVAWPLPKDQAARGALMMHESWHRVQSQLGFPATGPRNDHLDKLDGRLWLQLEWRALAEALRQPKEKRTGAVEDALLFRAYRRSLFKDAASEERALEMHEGLAEYTGVRLAALSETERAAYVVKKLEKRPAELPTFVRSFAYLSGPAYGLLLDSGVADWRVRLKKEDDLGSLLEAALPRKLPAADKNDLEIRAKRYEVAALRPAEEKRDQEIQKRIARYRATLIDGPRLSIPLHKMQVSFDPNTVQPIEGVGNVYPTIRISDDWGTLTVSDGALIDATFKAVHVIAPTDPKSRPLKEKAWELRLNDGWKLDAGERKGDFRVVKETEKQTCQEPLSGASKRRVRQVFADAPTACHACQSSWCVCEDLTHPTPLTPLSREIAAAVSL